MTKYFSLIFILVGYGIAGILYVTYTPAWQAPDEPAHYNYISQLAEGSFPIITEGDYNQAYQGEVIGSRFVPSYSVASFLYEDHQPPLYYLIQAPIFLLLDGSLWVLRLVSLILGAGVIVLTYLIAGIIFPQHPQLVTIATAFVAFLPQHLAILASVNNDSLAWLLIAGTLYLLVRPLPNNYHRYDVGIGILLGLGFITKGTAYIMAPVVGLWLLGQYEKDWQTWAQRVLLVGLPALLLGSLWWGRNLVVYGKWDVLGLGAHNSVVVGQPLSADWVAEQGFGSFIWQLIQTTFHSFWGQFGWMGVPMPNWVYHLLWLFMGGVVIGLMMLRHWASRPKLTNQTSLILWSTLLLNIVLFLGYNLTFVQHQGRYLFAALIPIAIGIALGVGGWLHWLKNWGEEWIRFVPALFTLSLFTLDIVALFQWIVPTLSLP